MNIISQFLYYYGLGIILTYLICNTFFSEYHALDSNLIKNIDIIIDDNIFRLEPYILDQSSSLPSS